MRLSESSASRPTGSSITAPSPTCGACSNSIPMVWPPRCGRRSARWTCGPPGVSGGRRRKRSELAVAHPLADGGKDLVLDPGLALDHPVERVPAEHEQVGGRRGDGRRGASPAENQGDLTEVVTGSQPPELAVVLADLDLARIDDEELVAGRALLGDHLARHSIALLGGRRDRRKLAHRQAVEERHPTERLGSGIGHVRAIVSTDLTHPAPRAERRRRSEDDQRNSKDLEWREALPPNEEADDARDPRLEREQEPERCHRQAPERGHLQGEWDQRCENPGRR